MERVAEAIEGQDDWRFRCGSNILTKSVRCQLHVKMVLS
jgi:hypothetical protein